MDNIEQLILRNLLFNNEYTRKVFPYIREEYFHTKSEKELFLSIHTFINKYNNSPTIESLKIEFDVNNLNPEIQKEIEVILENCEQNKNQKVDEQWLLDQTENWCKDKAIYNAVLESIQILDDKKGIKDKGILPTLLSDALAVSFDTNIGHDYFDDAEARYDKLHSDEYKIPFDLEYLNKITKNGVPLGTLNCIIAGINVGKSLIMCHLAASYIAQGKNVLYISMEMGEEELGQRIDANLYNMEIDDVFELSKIQYIKKMEKLRQKIVGKLKIKQFPTGAASVLHFKHLLNELKLKNNFIPDVVFVDYINICASSRIKMGGNANMYYYVKSISEELRGFAIDEKIVLWTATQLTRSGYGDSDPDMDDTAESFGLPATCDFLLAAITNEELEQMNQYLMKQLKNRYSDKSKLRRFVIGVNRAMQKLFDVETCAQQNISNPEDTPIMDKTEFGMELQKEIDNLPKSKFKGLRVE